MHGYRSLRRTLMDKEIIEIRRVNSAWEELPYYLWRVDYTVSDNGLRYFRHVSAKDELEAYSIVMGFNEQPKRKEEQ